MIALDNNLLALLHRWTPRQDENFTTEAFAHLLRHLLTSDPSVAAQLVNRICGRAVLKPQDFGAVTVTTQSETLAGKPDIEIRSSRAMVLIEAKVESGLTGDQLARYRGLLQASGSEVQVLVLLTRYPVETDARSGLPDVCCRWYYVADWLCNIIQGDLRKQADSLILAQQFLGFLQARNMTMEKVSWELKAGVESLMSLMQMLGEALAGRKQSGKFQAAGRYMGYSVQKGQGWVGVTFENPTKLYLHSYGIPVEQSAAEKLGGLVKSAGDSPNGWRWQLELWLDAEEVHFFARSRASQMQEIEKFLTQALAGLSQLTQAPA